MKLSQQHRCRTEAAAFGRLLMALVCAIGLSCGARAQNQTGVAAPGSATSAAPAVLYRLYSIPLTFTQPHEVLGVLKGAVSVSLDPYFGSGQVPTVDLIIPVEHNRSLIIRATAEGYNDFKGMVRCIDVPVGVPKPDADPLLIDAVEMKRGEVERRFYAGIGSGPNGEDSVTIANNGGVEGACNLRLLNATPQYVLDTLAQTLSSSLHPLTLSDALAAEGIPSLRSDMRARTLTITGTGEECGNLKDIVRRLGVKAVEETTPTPKNGTSQTASQENAPSQSQADGNGPPPAVNEAPDEPHHIYRIPLTYAKPQEVLDDLKNTLTSTLGPYFVDHRFEWIDFLIPVEQDHSILIRTSVDGFNLFKDVVTSIDVPTPPRADHPKTVTVAKPAMDPTLLYMLKKRQASLRFYDNIGGIPRYGGSGPWWGEDRRTYHLHLLNATPEYVLDTLKQSVSNPRRPVTWYNILPEYEIAYILPEHRTSMLIVRATPIGYADFKNIVQRLGVEVTDDAPAMMNNAKQPTVQ